MAANWGRKTLQLASSSTRTLFSRRSSPPSVSSSYATNFNGLSSPHKRALSFSRVPVQLAGAQVSLTPLHSVTASALFTSLLSLHNTNWGCLSEGFATPL
ncbi:protein NUCLEAR FUSION DEFECTIVE 6, chloroplastic/mitochondrial [Abrus precatorius]|uniref:Protein NUCLEAR FUSION DEFECTIVE 6, chloroplastic/mitochondrial n=1 Tax=Abrus precatorius TaxID=3816 RepID=A0A8B8M2K9_ABRPR|nr:protein NUCLEAR FUSION DEFECTIVE 6, chloroplastic/mitochondrial [Abrus precatorius]